MTADNEGWLTIHDVAAELGVPVQTVYGWRSKGTGPRGATFGRHVRFRRADVEAWIAARMDGSHSSARAV